MKSFTSKFKKFTKLVHQTIQPALSECCISAHSCKRSQTQKHKPELKKWFEANTWLEKARNLVGFKNKHYYCSYSACSWNKTTHRAIFVTVWKNCHYNNTKRKASKITRNNCLCYDANDVQRLCRSWSKKVVRRIFETESLIMYSFCLGRRQAVV